jgi:hypothetical protein
VWQMDEGVPCECRPTSVPMTSTCVHTFYAYAHVIDVIGQCHANRGHYTYGAFLLNRQQLYAYLPPFPHAMLFMLMTKPCLTNRCGTGRPLILGPRGQCHVP